MAQLDDPPSASSSDDETEDDQMQQNVTYRTNQQSSSSSSEEGDEEESSEEETIDAVKNSTEKHKIQNPNSKVAESSSEEESESGSEEETPTPVTSIEKPKTLTLKSETKSSSGFDFDSDLKSPTVSNFAIKPSKKINDVETPAKTPTSKRPSSESHVKAKKKIKVSNGDADDEKKSSIKRVWSDDVELLLLQGFIDYAKKGCSPLSDMDDFYQFTMDFLPVNASKSQLYDKIRRLKKKFRVNSEKASGSGEDPVFSKPHELKLFELSKKIWGIGGCESASVSVGVGGSNAKSKIRHSKVNPKIEAKEEDEGDETMGKIEDFETFYPHLNAALKSEFSSFLKFPDGVVTLIKEHLSYIGEARAKELDEKWEAFYEEEAVLRKRTIVLLAETISLGK